jgi:hypothetical protein
VIDPDDHGLHLLKHIPRVPICETKQSSGRKVLPAAGVPRVSC